MKYLLIIGLLVLIASGQQYSVKKCQCKDLKVEIDCKAHTLSRCTWQGTACVDYQAPIDEGDTSAKSLYCSTFVEADCAKTKGCAWVEKACTHFTGCTAFKLGTFDACQAISTDCITDGVHCVLIDFCNTYFTETSCLQSPKDRYLCYWDGKNCLNADKCEYLPKTYLSDKECREAIQTCTVNSTGQGCIKSASTCNQQVSKDQCIYDLNLVKICFWNYEWATDEYLCRDYTCDEAPQSYTTYQQCNDFGKQNKLLKLDCTTKKGGGCQNTNKCEDNKIKSACEYDSTGAKCIWHDTRKCILLNCEAAPTSLDTNEKCQDFVKQFTELKCITKSGGGCVNNGNCNAANIQSACKINTSGKTCFWDDTVKPNLCKELTCDNLPKIYKKIKECFDQLPECTLAQSGAGCIAKTCNNAPTDTSDCEAYLPGNNCVPKKDGGCQPLGDCSTILQSNCDTKKNKLGGSCFWDGSACKELICANLIGSNYPDHTACYAKLSTCTVKTGGNGCEDWKCENSFKKENCINDNCKWKGGICFKKECSLASKTYHTHQQCNKYLNSCTSQLEKNPAGGCALIPLICEGIFNEEACKLKKIVDANSKFVYIKCGWDGTKCIDQGCTTLSKTLNTTDECNSAGIALNVNIKNCVANNPNRQNEILGCIPLPSQCKDRKTQDNCVRKYGGTGPDCVWVPQDASGTCQFKACTTAHLDGSTSEVTIINNSNCKNYIINCTTKDGEEVCVSSCIANNDNTQCMNKPTQCSAITNSGNCEDDTKVNGHCVWNDSCKDKTCANLPSSYDTHDQCYSATKIDKTCTVNDNATGCIPLKINCVDYKDKEKQCVVTSNGKKCFFSKTCRDLTCADIDKTSSFYTHLECNTRLDTCTVVQAVGSQCTSKFTKCSDYAIESNCHKRADETECLWDGASCQQKSEFNCTLFKLNDYTGDNCKYIYAQCKPNSDDTGCMKRTCADYEAIDYNVTDDIECSQFDTTLNCTNTTATNLPCQSRQDYCSDYEDEETCTVAKEGKCRWYATLKCYLATAPCSKFTGVDYATCEALRPFCKLVSGTTCTAKACNDILVANATARTDDECKEFDSSCRSTRSDTDGQPACYEVKNTCVEYGSTESFCKVKASGKKCFWDQSGTPKCRDVANSTCNLITSIFDIIRELCQDYDTSCTANRSGTGCVQIQSSCTSYTNLENCVENTKGLCVQNQLANSGAICKDPDTNTTCNLIYLDAGRYTDAKCNSLNVLCTAKDDSTACIDRTCDNAADKTSFAKCNEWLKTCTWNGKTDGTQACVTIKDICSDQTTEATCFQAKEGECAVVSGKCKLLDCLDKTGQNITHYNCLEYSSKCALSNPGGCQGFSANCSDYKLETQCYKSRGNECFWNAKTKKCVDFTCNKIEQSASYSSHNQCFSLTNQNLKTINCTVRSNSDNTAAGQGCMALTSCEQYKIQDQCVQDSSSKPCQWVKESETKSICVNRTCSTADDSYQTHTSCLQYYKPDYKVDSPKYSCTVKAVKAENPSYDPIVGGGCIPLAACNTYVSEENCKINDQQGECGWNGQECADKSCFTAHPDLIVDHIGCQAYFNQKCTVAQTLKGCIDIPDTCEELKKEEQCHINKTGDKCYWDADNKVCITPTCDNAPQSFIDGSKCDEYYKICTQDTTAPCKVQVCEDFLLITDDACKEKLKECTTDGKCLQTCTTDGTKCVPRKLCNQALHRNGCVTDSLNKKCQWVSEKNQCEQMDCSTAPAAEYTTDDQCYNYYIPGECMLKPGGGCTNRTICTQIKTESACQSNNGDSQKVKCSWDNGSCRYQNCTDFNGKSHTECQIQFNRGECTVGTEGKCAAMQDCEKTTIQAACVKGLNGPCLWISGTCYPYTRCESGKWQNDKDCKAISPKCTTNGINCVSITSCELTNTIGGCKTGYDGECILIKTATGEKACKMKVNGCVDAAFTTWKECYEDVSERCSTDGVTCIELQECKDYKVEDACINSRSKTPASRTLTGKCHWDPATKTCHDELCAELVSNTTTNSDCFLQISQCTSNGVKCLDRTSCDKYEVNDVACNASFDTNNNPCFFEAASATNGNAARCRVKTCADLKVTECTLGFAGALSCVSDGTVCVLTGTCSTYKTKTSCNAGGTDGVCVFTPSDTGSCAKMTSCAQANNDQDACKNASIARKCSWTDPVTATASIPASPSKCSQHTCATYQAEQKKCEIFNNFDESLQAICQMNAGKCSEVDPKTLTAETCFSISGYTFTWNTGTVGCQACSTVTPQSNNNTATNPNTNNNGTNTVDSGYILGFAAVIIYTMF
ncbi:unnamed protein product [Paramecium sonneborni]|uniref:PSI domain-containing protein n=1 Tax=Paramecium sonneborni TaxID=65129 RepID=A0A8S1QU49_9CILI|nr:unnamed protein product [Paramecium sonneborni]